MGGGGLLLQDQRIQISSWTNKGEGGPLRQADRPPRLSGRQLLCWQRNSMVALSTTTRCGNFGGPRGEMGSVQGSLPGEASASPSGLEEDICPVPFESFEAI